MRCKLIYTGWRRKWHPLQCSCLDSPTDRGAWRAAVHRVARVRHDLATKQPPLYTRCLNNKVLLWSPGNCVQYPVMNHSGKEHENAVKVLVVSNSLQLHELYSPRLLCLCRLYYPYGRKRRTKEPLDESERGQ